MNPILKEVEEEDKEEDKEEEEAAEEEATIIGRWRPKHYRLQSSSPNHLQTSLKSAKEKMIDSLVKALINPTMSPKGWLKQTWTKFMEWPMTKEWIAGKWSKIRGKLLDSLKASALLQIFSVEETMMKHMISCLDKKRLLLLTKKKRRRSLQPRTKLLSSTTFKIS